MKVKYFLLSPQKEAFGRSCFLGKLSRERFLRARMLALGLVGCTGDGRKARMFQAEGTAREMAG